MRNRFTKHFLTLNLAMFPAGLFATSSGGPINHTGVPADGGLTCARCHTTYGQPNSDPRGRLLVKAAPYTPGVKQVISVLLSHPEAYKWGFQLTARLASAESKMAGSFMPNDEVQVRCAPDSRQAPCNGALESAGHRSISTNPGVTGWSTWQVEWTPPATEAGDIVFYAIGNAADNNGSNQGDRIYRTALRVYSATGCSLTGRPVISGVRNAASFEPGLSINSMMTVFGSGFAPGGGDRLADEKDLWDGGFPKQLECVAVEVAGKRAPLTFVRNSQINAQVPSTNDLGPVEVKVILNPGTPREIKSEPMRDAQLQTHSPAFFTFGGSRSIAATDAGGNILADPAVAPGGRAAKPGDVVVLYGSGFGVTEPFYGAGDLPPGEALLRDQYAVTIGSVTLAKADVLYAGLAPKAISGLYQFNVRIPASTGNGNIPVSIRMGNYETQKGATIPVMK